MKRSYWVKLLMLLGAFGALQFLLGSTVAMFVYEGGTIHHPDIDRYSFLYNFFSDLGRTRTPSGSPNSWASSIYIATLTTAGICTALYFLTLPCLFRDKESRVYCAAAMVLGIMAGISYIGISLHPYNEDYYMHTVFVRFGFIAFLLMSLAYAAAIFREKEFPKSYATVLLLFAFVLGTQVLIMIFGPRSWYSPRALMLQASAQKVVIYSEILVMLYLSVGSLRYYSKLRPVDEKRNKKNLV